MTWPMCSGDPARQRMKTRYPTAEVANDILLQARIQSSLNNNRRRKEVSLYWCRWCRGFHLTSKQPTERGMQ